MVSDLRFEGGFFIMSDYFKPASRLSYALLSFFRGVMGGQRGCFLLALPTFT